MNKNPLEAFTKITNEDPLFAAEGMDIENAQMALNALEEATCELEKIWFSGNFQNKLFCLRYPFVKSVHPVSFLKAFLDAESMRRVFVAKPSVNNAELLIKHYKSTVKNLEDDLLLYQKAHKVAAALERKKSNLETYYFFPDGIMVSFDHVLADIHALSQNTLKLRRQIEERESLLRSGIHEVETNQIPDFNGLFVKSGPEITPEHQQVLNIEEKGRKHIIREKFGPFFYTLSHFDGMPTTHTFFVYILGKKESSELSLDFTMADLRFYLSLDPKKYDFFEGLEDHYGPLLPKKIPYWHQTATKPYAVRDVQYYADLATKADLERRPKLNQTLVKRQRSSLLHMLLWNGASNEKSYVRIRRAKAELYGKHSSPYHFYISRSYPSLYYLPFNDSVWRLPKRHSFLGTRVSLQYAYKTLDEIMPNLTLEDLENVMRAGKTRAEGWEKMFNAQKNT